MHLPRRDVLVLLASLLAADASAGPRARHRRRVRRRVRRRIRRRHRRRVAWRLFGPRRALVVPVGLVVGYELAIAAERAGEPDQIVIVKEIKKTTVDNQPVEIAVVVHADGKTSEVEIVREDTKDNTKPLEGSKLDDADTTTPHQLAEEEVEEEVDE